MAAEIRPGKKEEEERNYRMKTLWSALLHRATIMTINDLGRPESTSPCKKALTYISFALWVTERK